jgi:hypothetical protein
MRGMRFAATALGAIVLLGSSSVLAIGPTEAMAKGGHVVIPASQTEEFQLKGSDGFSIAVSAGGRQVSLTAKKGGSSATYSVRGIASSKRIKARFAGLGLVSVLFRPSGQAHRMAAAENCSGEAGFVQPGKFVGKIEFEGEQAYTTVRASKAKGKETFARKQVCPKEAGEAGSPFSLTALTAVSSSDGVAFVALRLTRGTQQTSGFSGFGGTIFESVGRLAITRSIEASAGISAFATSGSGREITSATIAPPSPFTGSATYEKQKGSPATWTGALAGTFLGRGEVSLAGPAFIAEISH